MKKLEKATFAAGCFWGVEETFRTTEGVVSTMVGYTGGSTSNPTYEQVCSNATGHAEAVQVEFNPKLVSYVDLLHVFWSLHDPTTMNGQGLDIGSQYRSAIFYHGAEQKKAAEKSLKEEQKNYTNKIVTEIVPAGKFWKAEEYHQKYLMKTGKRVC